MEVSAAPGSMVNMEGQDGGAVDGQVAQQEVVFLLYEYPRFKNQIQMGIFVSYTASTSTSLH
jgi:hypothetical protein